MANAKTVRARTIQAASGNLAADDAVGATSSGVAWNVVSGTLAAGSGMTASGTAGGVGATADGSVFRRSVDAGRESKMLAA
jgi:hypothetical protein